MEYLAGLGAVAVLLVISGIISGSWNPMSHVIGADGRISTSKLQFFLWTIIVIFSYVAIYAARVRRDQYEAINEVPRNILIALGLSAITMTAAKGITVSYINNNQVQKSIIDPDTPAGTDTSGTATGAGAAIQDDSGYPDLSKIQMLAWTAIALVVYLFAVVDQVDSIRDQTVEVANSLPDIDATLMVLTGLSQGTYLGKKLVTTDTPRIVSMTPTQGKPGTIVTLTGQSLGGEHMGGQITFDGLPVNPDQIQWTDTSVSFAIPASHVGGRPWSPPQLITIGLNVGGQSSHNPQPFVVTAQ